MACVRSLSETFDDEGIAGEVVLVDCGSGRDEQRRLETAGADLFLPLAENRGYAGGVNAGLARTRSSRLLIANADVLFRTGSVRPLLHAVDDPSVGAAAPLAFWDSTERLRLPPGWRPGFRADLAQLTAGGGAKEDRRFAAFARDAVRLWERGGRATHLSGAVLAARRDAFDRVGRFDERFPLEYEETEWEDRLRAAGLELAFTPAARVVHLWGASAAAAPDAAKRKLASQARYRGVRYGAIGRRVLERAVIAEPSNLPRLTKAGFPSRPGCWVAVSTNPSLVPFAGAPLDEAFELPAEIAARMAGRPLYLRVFRGADGGPLETGLWEGE